MALRSQSNQPSNESSTGAFGDARLRHLSPRLIGMRNVAVNPCDPDHDRTLHPSHNYLSGSQDHRFQLNESRWTRVNTLCRNCAVNHRLKIDAQHDSSGAFRHLRGLTPSGGVTQEETSVFALSRSRVPLPTKFLGPLEVATFFLPLQSVFHWRGRTSSSSVAHCSALYIFIFAAYRLLSSLVHQQHPEVARCRLSMSHFNPGLLPIVAS